MKTKQFKMKQSCCTVTFCPLVPSWATTIHKFQGFEARFDRNDQFQHLIIDPGDIKSEQHQPGILYVAISCAKRMGDMTNGMPNHEKNVLKRKRKVEIPKQKDGSIYSLKNLSKQQQAVVIAAIDTIVNFLKNDKKYKPLRATVMGCGGTGKSFIINTIISIVRNMTQMNDTIKVGVPSGAAA
jgi:hypothetical protein